MKLSILNKLKIYFREIETREIPLILSDWFHVDSIELSAANPYNYAGTGTMLGTTYYHCKSNDKGIHSYSVTHS